MVPREAQARLKSRIWQSIAQSELDLSSLDKESLQALVDLVTAEAMLEMDEQLGESWSESAASNETETDQEIDSDKEETLWEGRPFLSVSLHYTITDERLHIAQGMFGRSYQNIELVRVQDIDFSQSFSERLLDLGDISVRSHDPSTSLLVLRNVKDPRGVYDILRRAVKKARQDYNLSYQEEM